MLLSVCAESRNEEEKMYGLSQRCKVRAAAVAARLRPRDLVLLAESAAFPEYLLSSFVLASFVWWINPTAAGNVCRVTRQKKALQILPNHP